MLGSMLRELEAFDKKLTALNLEAGRLAEFDSETSSREEISRFLDDAAGFANDMKSLASDWKKVWKKVRAKFKELRT